MTGFEAVNASLRMTAFEAVALRLRMMAVEAVALRLRMTTYGGERSFATANDAHLSDDEAVAKMGHRDWGWAMKMEHPGLSVGYRVAG
jgi:hypothetical protein